MLRNFHLEKGNQSSGDVQGKIIKHLFNLLAQGSTVALSNMRQPETNLVFHVNCLTVPYLPVTPTLRVRFVYKMIQYNL